LRNLLLPLTLTDFAGIVSAVVLIEYTFALPGVGWRLFSSIETGDLTMFVGAFLMLLAIATILGYIGVLFDFVRQRTGLPVELEKEAHVKADDKEGSAQTASKIGLKSLFGLMLRKKSLFIGLAIVFLFVILGLAAPLLTAYDPAQLGVAERYAQPVWYKSLFEGDPDAASFGLLGTDMFGRDVFSQFLYGARNAFIITVPMAFMAALVGLALGFAANHFGNLIDSIVKLFADTTLALPVVPLLIVVSWTLRSGSLDWALLWVLSALAVVAFRSAYQAQIGDRASAGDTLRRRLPSLFRYFFANFCFVMASLTLLSLISSFWMYYRPLYDPGFSTFTWGGMLSMALFSASLFQSWWLWVPPLSSILLLAAGFLLIGIGLDKHL
jgi:peptide/nickel transport system permease protein